MLAHVPQSIADDPIMLSEIKVCIHARIPLAISPEGDKPVLEIEGCEKPQVTTTGIHLWNVRKMEVSKVMEVFINKEGDPENNSRLPLFGKKKYAAYRKNVSELPECLREIYTEWDLRGLVI